MLCHGCHQVQGQPVGVRHVAGDEVDAAVHDAGDETDIARKSVKLGNYQSGAVEAACRKRGGKLRPVVSLAALHFHKLRNQLVSAACKVSLHGGTLGLKTETTSALPRGADP